MDDIKTTAETEMSFEDTEEVSEPITKESKYHDMLLSWLQFNKRIIEEAKRANVNPIIERINFLAIADSNLDEFIRTKFKPNKGLRKIITAQTSAMEAVYEEIVLELKEKYQINLVAVQDLESNPKAMKYLKKVFDNEIYPLIQPMILKDELPIPDMQDGGFFLVTKITQEEETKGFSGIIKMPENRLIKVKDGQEGTTFVRIDNLIEYFVDKFYKGKTIEWNKLFRVFRKIESLTALENKNYLRMIKSELEARKKAEVIMVDVSDNINGLESVLGDARKRKRNYPSGFGFLKDVRDLFPIEDEMVYPKAKPRIPAALAGKNIFDTITKQDVLVHFPYESFDLSTVRLLEEAASDPHVKVIKQTLYRVSHDSPIIKALTNAAHQGKQVIVLLELKAKMDEEHNLFLIDILKKAGCDIIFGPIQLKTHGKITLVVREEDGKLQKYCNIATGNFNDKTARIYEDFSYFCKERNKFKVGEDLCDLFNMLGGCSDMKITNELLIAPDTFRSGIEKEIDAAIESKKAHPSDPVEIKIKCNSFTDKQIADKLYEASSVGVKVSLIVRGMCIVKVGVPGLSENISCISVVGRYLEHSRVYEFIYRDDTKQKKPSTLERKVYIGSGDMMPRNLDYRVEVITPVKNTLLRDEIHQILIDYQNDTHGSYKMNPDGSYQSPMIDDPEFKGEDISVQNTYIRKYKKIEKSFMKS